MEKQHAISNLIIVIETENLRSKDRMNIRITISNGETASNF